MHVYSHGYSYGYSQLILLDNGYTCRSNFVKTSQRCFNAADAARKRRCTVYKIHSPNMGRIHVWTGNPSMGPSKDRKLHKHG